MGLKLYSEEGEVGKGVLVVDGCVDYGRDQGGRGGGSEEGVLQEITPPKKDM